jgi:hypothetical protein
MAVVVVHDADLLAVEGGFQLFVIKDCRIDLVVLVLTDVNPKDNEKCENIIATIDNNNTKFVIDRESDDLFLLQCLFALAVVVIAVVGGLLLCNRCSSDDDDDNNIVLFLKN